MIYGDDGRAPSAGLSASRIAALHCMFTMMNGARLATGLQGVAIAERAYQQALAYAQERRQGRAAGYTGAAPIIAHPDVRRMLGAHEGADRGRPGARLFHRRRHRRCACRRPSEAARRRGEVYAGLLTPIFKGFATENGVEVASLGIQVHGGMGYIEETGAAQHCATPASRRSTKAPTASRRSISSPARSRPTAAPACRR